MSKSYRTFLMQLFTHCLRDATVAFPQLESEFERDLTRLKAALDSRGIGGLCKDLPNALKHLDQCLDYGQYVPTNLPFTGEVSETIRIPKLFRGLYLLIFEDSGRLRKDADHEAVIFLRQLLGLAKRIKFECSAGGIEAAKLRFLQTDALLPEPSRLWKKSHDPSEGISRKTEGPEGSQEDFMTVEDSVDAVFKYADANGFSVDDVTPEPKTFSDLLADLVSQGNEKAIGLLESDPDIGMRLDRIFAYITSTLGPYDPSDWKFRHGPGAIAAKPGCVNKYEWYSWPASLDAMFPVSEYGFYSYTSWIRNIASIPEGAEASRLIAVDKSFEKPRLIAAEPNAHQWCQQNIRHYFAERSAGTWLNRFIRFRDQTRNQDLCRKGSVTGKLATLDLKDASDRMTCDVVEAAFGRNPSLLFALIASRTSHVTLETRRHGEFRLRLKKFSTMGSAVTFPVQSLVFVGIVLAVLYPDFEKSLALTGKRFRPADVIDSMEGFVSVYGDDIVVPNDRVGRLVEVLEVLHFQVNIEKTFTGSNFRESCGVDSFQGTNVTPAYVNHLCPDGPESMVGTVEAANHFYQRWMLNVSTFLRRTVEERYKFPYVHPDSGVTGFYTRVEPSIAAYQLRWNCVLHCVEIRCAAIHSVQRRIRPDDDSGLLQYFTEEPSPYDEWEAGWSERPELKIKLRWVRLEDLAGPWVKGEVSHTHHWVWAPAIKLFLRSHAVCLAQKN